MAWLASRGNIAEKQRVGVTTYRAAVLPYAKSSTGWTLSLIIILNAKYRQALLCSESPLV